ncbi:hypothetical protein [Streptomyces sp. NPDC047000]|uniref:hypothetical protein n=1 Tax=Streptomyces sp. NPDC047000 TaxID=3155474 RepID=UPI0033D1A38C
MNLVDLVAEADERGLAASGLACLDRCVPLLGGDDDLLRPLWSCLTGEPGSGDWGELLDEVRARLVAEGADGADGGADAGTGDAGDEAVLLARAMLAAAPAERTPDELRTWADACSVTSLRIHRLLDPAGGSRAPVDGFREGGTEGMPPLVAVELRRQTTVLELLAEHGAAGLRPALEVCTEGRRVLRAVVHRRARSRA